jgi:ketosteroid isomerase-like protein
MEILSMKNMDSEIWNTVEALNRCWTSGNPADLRDYFHDTMIAITPADRMPLVGGDICVSAWTKYAEITEIHSWQTREPRIQIYDQTAVVTYCYELVCERDGELISITGRDMMVLIEEDDRWWVVADQFSPFPVGDSL